ncbi:hypothetical protein [Fischerella thermalis]|uniref:hypothetical protein n=1 Tax=Fischerella thermalis TaxID=372787 RepID=UPI0012F9B9F8|nr:hypothetical protein [Fischerella thermalis]
MNYCSGNGLRHQDRFFLFPLDAADTLLRGLSKTQEKFPSLLSLLNALNVGLPDSTCVCIATTVNNP